MKSKSTLKEEAFALERKAVAHFLEEIGQLNYLDEVMSILRGDPFFEVISALQYAAETYPSDYLSWEEDSEPEVLAKYLEWETNSGEYADDIWKIFRNPKDYLKNTEVEDEARYRSTLVMSSSEMKELIYYPRLEIVEVSTGGPDLPRGFSEVTLEGTREDLLEFVRWIQEVSDEDEYEFDPLASDEYIVANNFMLVGADTCAEKVEDNVFDYEEEDDAVDYDWRDDFIRQNSIQPYGSDFRISGIMNFTGLSKEALIQLVDRGFADPEEKQNDAPTIGWMIANLPADTKFGGYVVSRNRSDTRVSIDTLEMSAETLQALPQSVKEVLETADEYDEFKTGMRIWWD